MQNDQRKILRMGRYEKYRKQKPPPRRVMKTVQNVIIVILLVMAAIGFIIQIVMNQ